MTFSREFFQLYATHVVVSFTNVTRHATNVQSGPEKKTVQSLMHYYIVKGRRKTVTYVAPKCSAVIAVYRIMQTFC